MMRTQWSKKFRPTLVEALEDRAVPSTLGGTVHAEQSGSTNVQAQLAQVDTQIEAAYSAFASSVFQAEGALITSGGTGIQALLTSVSQAITTLQGSLTTAVQGSISNNALGLVQAQVTGSNGSLLTGMEEILNASIASSPTGSISPSSYALLGTAVNGQISASFTSAIVEAYLYASGSSSGNGSNVNLGQYASRASAAYTSFASTIFRAETVLYPYGGTTPPASTALAVVGVVDSQIGGLVQSLGSLVAGTSVASRASVIQSQFIGPGSSLTNEMNSLFAASASPDGSIPASSLPLLTAAVDAAISQSFTTTAVEGYLLATS